MPDLIVQSNITHPKDNGESMVTHSGPLKVAIVGNFSGNAASKQSVDLLASKHLRITKDTFDEVFDRLKVALKLPIDGTHVTFDDIDELNPDHIYQHVPAFKRYRELIVKLQSPQHFHDAVEQLEAQGIVEPIAPAQTTHTAPAKNLLDSVLSNAQQNESSGFSVDALIRQTIAPYIEKQQDARAEHYTAAVKNAVSDLLRSILHASAFKQLEASWRGLDLINRRLDTDRACHLYLVDAALSALIEDAMTHTDNVTESSLFRNLIADKSIAGEKPFDVILIDTLLTGKEDSQLLPFLTQLAYESGAKVLTGAQVSAAGYSNLDALLDNQQSVLHDGVDPAARSQAGAKNTFICTPPFMARLPYGAKTMPIDSFQFEELPISGRHEYYLWANSAYLLFMTLVDSNNAIGTLPFHTFSNPEGEHQLVPPTGAYLPVSAVGKLEEAGFTVAQSVKHSDSVLIQRHVNFAS